MNKNSEVPSNPEGSTVLFSELCLISADIDKALSIFNELRKQDPYRIENMDTFSNLLYVRVSCFLCLDLIKLLCFESPGLDYHLVALDTRKIRVSFSCLDHLSFLSEHEI